MNYIDISLVKVVDNEMVGACNAKDAPIISMVLGEKEPFICTKQNAAVVYSKNTNGESFFIEFDCIGKKANVLSYRVNGKSSHKVSSELSNLIQKELVNKYKFQLKEIDDYLQAIASWNFIEEMLDGVIDPSLLHYETFGTPSKKSKPTK